MSCLVRTSGSTKKLRRYRPARGVVGTVSLSFVAVSASARLCNSVANYRHADYGEQTENNLYTYLHGVFGTDAYPHFEPTIQQVVG